MEDVRLREPVVRQLLHALPDDWSTLATAVQAPPPLSDHLVAEARERTTVRRHRVIVEVAANHLRQPSCLTWDRLGHAPSQVLFFGLQLRPHSGTSGVSVCM